ncbi:unnamed protein product, partial [Amoebophrya sp. A25]|eukprot:GSA25T00024518001.1
MSTESDSDVVDNAGDGKPRERGCILGDQETTESSKPLTFTSGADYSTINEGEVDFDRDDGLTLPSITKVSDEPAAQDRKGPSSSTDMMSTRRRLVRGQDEVVKNAANDSKQHVSQCGSKQHGATPRGLPT